MSNYDQDPKVRAYIDERLQEINEKIYPLLNGKDCTVGELRLGLKREKELMKEIKAVDKEFYMSIFDV